MICGWNNFLSVLPEWMVHDIDCCGKNDLQEVRMRLNSPTELIMKGGSRWINRKTLQKDIDYCLNCASEYSPWAASTIAKGYITVRGGHRIGICGEVTYINGILTGMKTVSSLCIRIARDFPGISHCCFPIDGSVLILGGPGNGKTTLLRDLCRRISEHSTVAVVDEREELFPDGIQRGRRMDVLSGVRKHEGIEMMLRTMGPEYIAVDEITNSQDCTSVLEANGCGVRLIATAHAGSVEDYRGRKPYKPLVDQKVFQTAIILARDKTYRTERFI